MENSEKQPTGRTRGLARFLGWWQRNGHSILAAFAGVEALDAVRRAEEELAESPHSPPEEDPPRRAYFARWGKAMNDLRAGRDRAIAEQMARIIPDGVPDDILGIDLTPERALEINSQVGAMHDWLANVEPRDFGEPPSAMAG